jgi:hypothetical protein
LSQAEQAQNSGGLHLYPALKRSTMLLGAPLSPAKLACLRPVGSTATLLRAAPAPCFLLVPLQHAMAVPL